MLGRQSVIRQVQNCRSFLWLTPSEVPIQRTSRGLHTTVSGRRRNTGLIQYSTGLFRSQGKKSDRIAAYFIITRNESTNTIPPLTSEVFSKQADSISSSITAVATPAPIPATTTSETVLSSGLESQASPAVLESLSTTAADTQQQLLWEAIPEPPTLPVTEELALALSSNGEPTFASIGLGSWTPPGIVQQCMQFFHVDFGLPWWGAILLGTVCVRLLVFPLVIKSQRNAAKMANNMPQMQALQLKMSEARQTGNALMAAKSAQDLMVFMKEKDVSPFKNLLVPIAMAPIFISFFMGLRKMANLPVESMKEGGLFWFADLTVADPYFILPAITSLTMWITLEMGVDGVQLNASTHGNTMRYVIRAIPLIVFPLTMNFPAAILCYWVSTNAVSLVQVSLLKIPSVRKALNIEPLRKFSPDALPMKKKPFVESVKESWQNVKISKEMEDRLRYDEMAFKRAGRGPIPKTYKYDPTNKIGSPTQATAVHAKQK